MTISDLRWADRSRSRVTLTYDGNVHDVVVDAPAFVPSLVREWIADGKPVAAYSPTADDVRVECQRRIFVLLGVSTLEACTVKQLNATMRATELTNKLARGDTMTPTEEAEAAQLEALAAAIKRLRAASNALGATPPADYASDVHWQ